MIAQSDTTPPLLAPQVFVRAMDDAQQVDLIFQPPELSDYIFKFGAPDTINCTDEAGYERFRRIPPIIEKEELPVKLFAFAFDNAGPLTMRAIQQSRLKCCWVKSSEHSTLSHDMRFGRIQLTRLRGRFGQRRMRLF